MTLDIPLSQIDEGFARLRLTNPKAERTLLSSIRKYGQVSPVILFKVSSHRYEMVDGFKRLRVCRQLNYQSLQANLVNEKSPSFKTAMIFMNWEIRSITDLEEGLVIKSLYREDGYNQISIAQMLGRHKSWVCRRIALVERLSDKVLDHIRLGLINPTIGRELSKLPRGNQQAALQAVLKHRLTTRQTVYLVARLQAQPQGKQETFLNGLTQDYFQNMGTDGLPKKEQHGQNRGENRKEGCFEKLRVIESLLRGLLKEADLSDPPSMTAEETQQIFSSIVCIRHLIDQVQSSFHAMDGVGTTESTTTLSAW